jgi:hypothetical protein
MLLRQPYQYRTGALSAAERQAQLLGVRQDLALIGAQFVTNEPQPLFQSPGGWGTEWP